MSSFEDWVRHFGWVPPVSEQTTAERRPLIYVGGSMTQRERILSVVRDLRAHGFETFVDWIMPGPETDVQWQEAAQALGLDYLQALKSAHARHAFDLDKRWLDRADAFVLVAPCGKSAHIELGYMAGTGKVTAVLLHEEPERWDLMLLFADIVSYDLAEIIEHLEESL